MIHSVKITRADHRSCHQGRTVRCLLNIFISSFLTKHTMLGVAGGIFQEDHTVLRWFLKIFFINFSVTDMCSFAKISMLSVEWYSYIHRSNHRRDDNTFHAWTWYILASISNYIQYKVWDEVIYQFPNFNGCIINVWEWITGHVVTYIYPCWDPS